MKKSLFFAAAAAAMALASCSSEDAMTQEAQVASDAIGFGVYTNTVGSKASNVDVDYLKQNGFGVFAYSTEQSSIKDFLGTNYTPNFMYNQKVDNTADLSVWNYTPIKYWPNNPGAMVSFFAYAPYISDFDKDEYVNTPDNNNVLANVKYVENYNTRLQFGKDYQGPGVEYAVPENPTKGIDLLWGCEKGGTTAPVNKLKPAVDENIDFMFKHALSRLHFNIQVWPDEVAKDDAASAAGLAENTTIKVDKVELVGNIAKSGTLRLYDGSWNVESGNYANLVFQGKQLNDDTQNIHGNVASQEIDLLAGHSMEGGQLIAENDIDNYVMLIPGSTFFIRVTYTVTTIDPSGNEKNNSVVTNVRCTTDADAVGNVLAGQTSAFIEDAPESYGYVKLEAGKAYDFHINIGMNSVRFTADVENWKYAGNEIHMPLNK